MTSLKRRLNNTLVALAFVSLTVVTHSSADTINFPKDKPLFVFNLPIHWTHTTNKDGDLICDPGDKSAYSLQVISSGVTTQSEMKTALPDFAKSIATASKIIDLELSDVEDISNGNKVPFTGIVANGKSVDGPLVLTLLGFEPVKGTWYIIFTVAKEKADKAHTKDYVSIFDSIQTVK